MSNFIEVHNTGGLYGLWHGIRVDSRPLVDHIAKPILAQHIPDDGRLEAALEEINIKLSNFIVQVKAPTAKETE